MHANSRPVSSRQSDIHPQLHERVARHAASLFRKPIALHNQLAFDASIETWRQAGSAPLILDAGCGVGLSSHHLAARFPDHFIIGIDQSADRLGRGLAWPGTPPSNLLLVRADLTDYWRLMEAAGIALARHYLLYPNPWPKPGQLTRRWHAHPVFPSIIALGGDFECRSNWKPYVDECARALQQLSGLPVAVEAFDTVLPITPFEAKYRASGHGLWQCQVDLRGIAGQGRSAGMHLEI